MSGKCCCSLRSQRLTRKMLRMLTASIDILKNPLIICYYVFFVLFLGPRRTCQKGTSHRTPRRPRFLQTNRSTINPWGIPNPPRCFPLLFSKPTKPPLIARKKGAFFGCLRFCKYISFSLSSFFSLQGRHVAIQT